MRISRGFFVTYFGIYSLVKLEKKFAITSPQEVNICSQ